MILCNITDDGVEYWSARELCKVLGYNEFNKFIPVIKRPYLHVRIVDFPTSDHFAEVGEMISTGKGAQREFSGYLLTYVMPVT